MIAAPLQTPRQAPSQAPSLLVISDSTGNLARQMLDTVLSRYPNHTIQPQFECFVRDREHLGEVLRNARRNHIAICYSLNDEDLKNQIRAYCKSVRILSYDLTGGIVQFLKDCTSC